MLVFGVLRVCFNLKVYCVYVVLGFQIRAWCIIGKFSITKLHTQPALIGFSYCFKIGSYITQAGLKLNM